MNILILNWRDIKNEWAGGGEVYVFELAKRWVKMGHNVTLFCGQDIKEKLPDQEKIDGISVIRKGGRYSLYFWAVWYYFRELRKTCDIVVDVQNGIPFFSVLYSRKPKVAIVYHVHNQQFFLELPFPLSLVGFIIERYIFPLVYRSVPIMAISKTTKKALIELGFPGKNIHIVYCGMNGYRAKRDRVQGKFVQPTILYLGRIKKYKRVDMLVKLMPKILQKVPQARLLIAGWGTEASAITDMSMRSITRRRIRILGPISDQEKKLLLSKSWVFVNPSIGEGWSISVIEANLHGTPAVAFHVAGLSESIKDGKTGFLATNEEDFIEKICDILRDDELRIALSSNAKKWAETFSWEDASIKSMQIMKIIMK